MVGSDDETERRQVNGAYDIQVSFLSGEGCWQGGSMVGMRGPSLARVVSDCEFHGWGLTCRTWGGQTISQAGPSIEEARDKCQSS